jgi:MFS family permease
LALIRDSVDEHLRGTAIGIYYTLIGVGYIVASWAAGWLWSHLGCKYAFMYSICICVLSLVLSKSMIKENERTA